MGDTGFLDLPIGRRQHGGRRLSTAIAVSALVLAAVVTPLVISRPGTAGTRVDMRVLLIGGPGGGTSDPTTASWAAGLAAQGVAYTEVDAVGTTPTETVTLPALTASPFHGLYDGVVIADDPADFAAGQLSALFSYESTFGIRQLDGYVFPTASYGLTDLTSGPLTETANLTQAGLTTFPSLTGPVSLDAGTYGYPAALATGLPTGASETPLLTDTTGVLMGIYQHPSASQDPSDPQAGVTELTIGFNYNPAQSQWVTLGPSLIQWVASGVKPSPEQYDLVGSDGGVFVFGPTGTGFYGSLPGLGVHVNSIVGIVPTGDNKGYFLVGSDGGVFAFGDAPFENSLPGLGVHVHNIVGIVPTGDNKGYFLVGSDGGVFAFGDAPFENSLPGLGVHVKNIVGIAGNGTSGYWVVGSDGAVYALGNAGYYGGLGGASTTPIVGIAATESGNGYWLVSNNGSVSAFGDAQSYGSLPALGVHVSNVVALVPTPDQLGYWLVGSDGGIFAFGDAQEIGSLPGLGVHVADIVGGVPAS